MYMFFLNSYGIIIGSSNILANMFNQIFLAFNMRKQLKCIRLNIVECRRNIALKECFFFTIKSTKSQRSLNAINLEHLRPEKVLSEKNRKSFIEKFKTRKRPTAEERTNEAAVLVPLSMYKGELGFLYTLRSTKLSSNRGQVSFPGGMYDKEDRDLEETALRETWEELRIPKEKIDVWTSGNVIDKKNLKVLPVFGYIGEIDPEKLQINTNEVEEAFFLSLNNLCDPSFCRYTQFRDNYTLPAYLGGKHRVWGFTAAITHMVLKALVPDAYKHELVYIKNVLPEKKR